MCFRLNLLLGLISTSVIMVLNLLVRSALQVATNRTTLLSARSVLPIKPVVTDLHEDQIYQTNASTGAMVNFIQSRGAARKGKRIARARKNRELAAIRRLQEKQNPKLKKAKASQVKMDKELFRFTSVREIDESKPDPPTDDVYFMEKFRPKRFSLDEILEFHRQSVHPDIFNQPDALVTATVELNLKMKIKKKKFIEKIDSTLCYPHLFQYAVKPRKIVALCPKPEDQEAAREAGAIIAGGIEIAQQLRSKQLTERDFDHLVCQTSFLTDFAAVKTMKAQPYFPTKARGNFGDNMAELVRYFKDGIDYSLKKKPEEPEYGFIECYFGRLNMPNDQLSENLLELFKSINRFKPLNMADGKQFFQRVTVTTPATDEVFLLKFWDLIDEYQDPDQLDNDGEEERKASAVS